MDTKRFDTVARIAARSSRRAAFKVLVAAAVGTATVVVGRDATAAAAPCGSDSDCKAPCNVCGAGNKCVYGCNLDPSADLVCNASGTQAQCPAIPLNQRVAKGCCIPRQPTP